MEKEYIQHIQEKTMQLVLKEQIIVQQLQMFIKHILQVIQTVIVIIDQVQLEEVVPVMEMDLTMLY